MSRLYVECMEDRSVTFPMHDCFLKLLYFEGHICSELTMSISGLDAQDAAKIAFLRERAAWYAQADAAEIRCGPHGQGVMMLVEGPQWARIRPVLVMWFIAQAEFIERRNELGHCAEAVVELGFRDEYGTDEYYRGD